MLNLTFEQPISTFGSDAAHFEYHTGICDVAIGNFELPTEELVFKEVPTLHIFLELFQFLVLPLPFSQKETTIYLTGEDFELHVQKNSQSVIVEKIIADDKFDVWLELDQSWMKIYYELSRKYLIELNLTDYQKHILASNFIVRQMLYG